MDTLLDRLRTATAADPQRAWDVADPGSVGLGEDHEVTRDRLAAQADVVLVLVSPHYLARSPAERRRGLGSPGPVVAFALSGLPEGPLDLGPLHRDDVQHADGPWDELTHTAQRKRYVDHVLREIRRALRRGSDPADRAATGGGICDRNEEIERWSGTLARSKRPRDSTVAISADSADTTLAESRLGHAGAASGPPQPAVARLGDWATATVGPRLCALLGDVGMGKTTTAKLFTQQLLDLRAAGTPAPLPILFDLRDVRITGLVASMTLDHILDGMLDANRPPGVSRERLSAGTVRERLHQGDAVVMFDGLDEVLVHLNPHDRQLFTRQLWRAVGEGSGARMLLSCRTQYFRTIRDQVGYFTTEGRDGLGGDDYLALLMLPFREEQVREYLAANLGRDEAWVDGVPRHRRRRTRPA